MRRSSPVTSGLLGCGAAIVAAVCAHRSSGLEMIPSSGTWASRSATAAAWAWPLSSSGMPGVRPASAVPVAAVRPCRTTSTRVTHRLYGVPPPGCAEHVLVAAGGPMLGGWRLVSAGRAVGDDEADRAEADVVAWLDRNPGRHPPAVQPGPVR